MREIRRIEDAALLLFPHTMYKSYPLSAIENNQFDWPTRWVGTLTALDVSAGRCGRLREHRRLDRSHGFAVAGMPAHSSGTTGKLSFILGSEEEAYTSVMGMSRYFMGFGDEPDADCRGFEGGDKPLVGFGYRRGAMAFSRSLDAIQKYFYRGEEGWILHDQSRPLQCRHAPPRRVLEAAAARGEAGRAGALGGAARATRAVPARAGRGAEAHGPVLPHDLDRAARPARDPQRRDALVVEAAVNGLARGLQRLFDPASSMSFSRRRQGPQAP
ncbi:MAG: hypothetical protein U1F11_07015 [Steroidobacteraceae bacterium]